MRRDSALSLKQVWERHLNTPLNCKGKNLPFPHHLISLSLYVTFRQQRNSVPSSLHNDNNRNDETFDIIGCDILLLKLSMGANFRVRFKTVATRRQA